MIYVHDKSWETEKIGLLQFAGYTNSDRGIGQYYIYSIGQIAKCIMRAMWEFFPEKKIYN